MKKTIEYMDRLLSYLENKDYDNYLKEMDYMLNAYSCFSMAYNKSNDVSLSEVEKNIVKEKIESFELKLSGCQCQSGYVVDYRGLRFCEINLKNKTITFEKRNLLDIEKEIGYIKDWCKKIDDQFSSRLKNPDIDTVKDTLKQIKFYCEQISIPIDNWEATAKQVSEVFKEFGFEVHFNQ